MQVSIYPRLGQPDYRTFQVKVSYQRCLQEHKDTDILKLNAWLDDIMELGTVEEVLGKAGVLGVMVFFEVTEGSHWSLQLVSTITYLAPCQHLAYLLPVFNFADL